MYCKLSVYKLSLNPIVQVRGATSTVSMDSNITEIQNSTGFVRVLVALNKTLDIILVLSIGVIPVLYVGI